MVTRLHISARSDVMKKIFFIFVLLLLFVDSGSSQENCGCKKTERFGYGGHELITMIEKKSYRKLEGVVTISGDDRLEKAIIEVYPIPDQLGKNNARTRLAVCETGKQGRFCFPQFTNGKYRLTISAEGFKVIDFFVTISPKSRRKNKDSIQLYLPVGT